ERGRANERPRAIVPVLFCRRRRRHRPRGTWRRACHHCARGQKDHPRHDGGRLRSVLGMTLAEYILLAASSLFVMVDPLATVPAFLSMTQYDTPEQRIQMARIASLVVAGMLITFALAGKWIFKFL